MIEYLKNWDSSLKYYFGKISGQKSEEYPVDLKLIPPSTTSSSFSVSIRVVLLPVRRPFLFSVLPPTQSERRLKLLFPPTTNSHHPNGQPLIIVNKRRAGGTGDPLLYHFNFTLGCVSFPSQLSANSGACPADHSAGAEYITREAASGAGEPAYLYFWGPKSDCRNC